MSFVALKPLQHRGCLLRHAVSAWLVACVVTFAAGPVHADEDSEYEAAISDAVSEFSAGRWEEARALFLKAHNLSPSARTLRGLGMVEFELRKYTASVKYLTAALSNGVQPLEGDLRESAQELLNRARGFVGTFRVTLSPENAVIRVDGRAVQLEEDGSLILDVGSRNVEVSADGYTTLRRPVEVVGGETKDLELRLQSANAEPEPAAPAGASQASGQADFEADSGTGTSTAPWLLVGGGGALVAGGLVVGGLALGAQSDFRDACPKDETCPDTEDNHSKQDKAENLALVSDILWISGAAVAGAGLFWLILEPKDEPDATQASFVVTPKGGALVMKGSF